MKRVKQSFARLSVWLSTRFIASRHPDWARAMRSEFEYVDEGDASGWALGYAEVALVHTLRRMSFVLALLGSDIAVIWMDWVSRSDVPTLLVIAGATLTLGYIKPRRALVAACGIGLAPLAAHTFVNLIGKWWPPYQYAPLAPRDYAILTSVAVFAGAFSWVGVRAAGLLESRSCSSRS